MLDIARTSAQRSQVSAVLTQHHPRLNLNDAQAFGAHSLVIDKHGGTGTIKYSNTFR
jgi:hypothetical protein